MSFLGLFRRAEPADGASPALEAVATGIDPALLVAASIVPTAAGRREREAGAGADVVADAIGAKVLHGWLQNRHQTLMPLNLNLAILSPERQDGLAAILASLLVSGRPADGMADVAPVLRRWLAGLGAPPDALSRYDEAIAAPLPLNVIFERAQSLELAIYTYVAALMTSDARFPVSVMLCDLVQARFDLPSAVVRSAVRRYRR